MKTIGSLILALLIASGIAVRGEGPAEKAVDSAGEVAKDTVDTAKNAAHKVVKGTRKAVHKVKEALAPDPDANRVDVKVTADSIDMSHTATPGKTAFVVTNTATEKLDFKVQGDNADENFSMTLAPNETKVLQVNLPRGNYRVACAVKGHQTHRMDVRLNVK